MKSFASDNNSGVHEEVLSAIISANKDHAVGYGNDSLTKQASDIFEAQFGKNIEVAFTFNGTGANIISLSLGSRSFNGVICTSVSHINVDECGSPENFSHCKLIDEETTDGKLKVSDIERNLTGTGSEHHVQVKMISITQPNEYGILYTCEEIKEICNFAHKHDLLVHMDGARLSNAAAALGITLRQTSRDLGVDILSLGGTKNGMMYGEAVVVFNEQLFGSIKYVRKQAAQLASKMRFISAQFIALLSNDLWLRNAINANLKAAELGQRVKALGIRLTREVEVNAVFAILNKRQIEELQKKFFFYVWNEATGEVRWMTSFDTSQEDIDSFVLAVNEVKHLE